GALSVNTPVGSTARGRPSRHRAVGTSLGAGSSCRQASSARKRRTSFGASMPSRLRLPVTSNTVTVMPSPITTFSPACLVRTNMALLHEAGTQSTVAARGVGDQEQRGESSPGKPPCRLARGEPPGVETQADKLGLAGRQPEDGGHPVVEQVVLAP